MTVLLTSAQMQAIERATMAGGRVTGACLMHRAGLAVADRILARWPGPGRAVVLCGPGNNGGDGYVVAQALARSGWAVRVCASADPATPDAQAARAHWAGPVYPLSGLDRADFAGAPLVVDAIFGTGLRRSVPRPIWGPMALAQQAGCALVAVDILSGLCAESGRVRSEGGYLDRPADLTVTFDSQRPGHVLDAGGVLSGPLQVADIGTGPARAALVAEMGDAVASLARPCPGLDKTGGHKFDHGHLLVLGGGPGQGGAARLAARGALRAGAGLVTLACPPAALQENAARLDAVMLRPVKGADALAVVLGDARITALCLGPGLGVDRAADLLPVVLAAGSGAVRAEHAPNAARRGVVIDADALTALARDPGLFARLHDRCVLTPHGGEFARLFPDIAARLAAPPAPDGPTFSKLDAVRAAAARSGAVVLLKGADTVIADPLGACIVHAALRDRAAPWLATAGSGDVLAGLIAGLLARGLGVLDAVQTGVWLHVEAAIRLGPGLIAEDLPDALPGVFRTLKP
jgi:hydroxyethylthiazole kinase-like uncharacterized protein yjeF